jgi:hypothetical protein
MEAAVNFTSVPGQIKVWSAVMVKLTGMTGMTVTVTLAQEDTPQKFSQLA